MIYVILVLLVILVVIGISVIRKSITTNTTDTRKRGSFNVSKRRVKK